jgi:tetratricopeptide (TPR) repeat protein
MPEFDAEELLHLGLHATKNNDPENAIEHLKRCLDIEPNNAKATYLLGAVYAQLGLYDRAKQFLQQAVTLNPQEYTAVFQLGLLQLTSGDVGAAQNVWRGLDELGAEHFLHLFKSGMLALAEDRFVDCIDLLERGIRVNSANEALNNDMRNVLASAQAAASAAPAADVPGVNHLVLSGYQQAQPK